MARPTEYTNEFVTKTREYLATTGDVYEVKTRPVFREVKGADGEYTQVEKEESYVVFKVKVPSIEGLAVYLGIHKDTIYEWEKIHQEFSDVISELRAKQAECLISGGLSGRYNSTIAKLLLTKHGYSDKQETDIKSDGQAIQPILVKFIDKPNDTQQEGTGL